VTTASEARSRQLAGRFFRELCLVVLVVVVQHTAPPHPQSLLLVLAFMLFHNTRSILPSEKQRGRLDRVNVRAQKPARRLKYPPPLSLPAHLLIFFFPHLTCVCVCTRVMHNSGFYSHIMTCTEGDNV
jgi:hypothetical protein